MQNCLQGFGPGGGWVLPVLVLAALLGWHFTRKCPWTCHYETLMGMLAESLLFAMLLVIAGRLLHALVVVRMGDVRAPLAISFLGAGIYEETLFRLFLLPCVYQLLRLFLVPSQPALLASALCSSLLFALAHYGHVFPGVEPAALAAGLEKIAADPQLRFSFAFRLLAGGTFSTLFWLRGFGITVGCHLLYDLIVGVLLAGIDCS